MLPTISGEWTVGSDPNLRFTPSGMAITEFRAVASKRKEEPAGSGNWVDAGQIWVSVTCFKHLAEHVAESIEKGQRVLVIGDLEDQQWEGKQDGAKMSARKILAKFVGPSLSNATARVTKIESGGNQQGGGGNRQQAQGQPAQRPAGNDPWATGPDDEPPF